MHVLVCVHGYVVVDLHRCQACTHSATQTAASPHPVSPPATFKHRNHQSSYLWALALKEAYPPLTAFESMGRSEHAAFKLPLRATQKRMLREEGDLIGCP